MSGSTSRSGPQSARHRALRIQKKIYNSLQLETTLLLGETPSIIKKYEKENRKDFRLSRRRIPAGSKTELIEAIRRSDVTLIADYHTFEQAQRTALRIIRESVQENETWYLGIEIVPSQFQDELDRFQEGKMTLEDFHHAISYSQEWGFPWAHYAPLFEWARLHRVRMIALNRPKAFVPSLLHDHDLDDRDIWAAGVITDLFHGAKLQKRTVKMIILYGELHVGSSHIPKRISRVSRPFLRRALSIVIVHQNENQLYWKLAEQGIEHETTIARLKKNTFCVFSSTPWNKLQSLVTWAEGGDPDLGSEMDDLSVFCTYGNAIAEFFGLSALSYESLNTYRIEQLGFLETLENQKSAFTQEEKKIIRLMVTQNQRIYIPSLGIAFLGSSTYNGIAELAGAYLLNHQVNQHLQPDLSPSHFFRRTEEDFFRIILEGCFSFFASMILNPKRKCDLVQDHFKRIKDLQTGEKPIFSHELTARLITLQFMDPKQKKWYEPYLKLKQFGPSIYLAARYIGQIYGKKLYLGLLAEKVSVEWIKERFLTGPEGDFSSAFTTIQASLESIQVGSSKHDHL